ncbi:hypothetical protein THRCLA_01592 [Thraustotheca clavata]|uniref:Uncharacterized protein n=1 Tax=Thraustotheca clavata TaxID=74557 RepID=A0A1W0A7U8_9STRA|nr:hypothetical protein THRCLA_01592 [Thraustotheca clavata]
MTSLITDYGITMHFGSKCTLDNYTGLRGLYDELSLATVLNGSLIRQAPDFRKSVRGYLITYWGYTHTLQQVTWGPFLTIDTYLQGKPKSLITLVGKFNKFVMEKYGLLSSFREVYNSIPDAMHDIVPLGWRIPGSVHYGSNPMCVFSTGTSFIQTQFSWDDSCSSDSKAVLN